MCFDNLVDLDKSVFTNQPASMVTESFVLLSLWFDKCFGWSGSRIPSWTMSTKQSPRPVVSQGITQMLNRYLSWILDFRYSLLWKLEITTKELWVWYLRFRPRLLVQSKWSELCLGDRFNPSSGPFQWYKPWLLDCRYDKGRTEIMHILCFDWRADCKSGA